MKNTTIHRQNHLVGILHVSMQLHCTPSPTHDGLGRPGKNNVCELPRLWMYVFPTYSDLTPGVPYFIRPPMFCSTYSSDVFRPRPAYHTQFQEIRHQETTTGGGWECDTVSDTWKSPKKTHRVRSQNQKSESEKTLSVHHLFGFLLRTVYLKFSVR